jgi:uncharacterized protein (DUF3084 family)
MRLCDDEGGGVMSELDMLQQAIEKKRTEIKQLQAAQDAIYFEKQKTCKHPNQKSTPYEKWCDDCGWHKDRSF